MIAGFLLSLSLVAPADAAQLEAQAFAAIDDKRWCDAASLFLAAQAEAPKPETLANASLAAALGGSRAEALALLERALVDAPQAKRTEYAQRRDALVAAIAHDGPGVVCPAPAPVSSSTPPPETPPPASLPPPASSAPRAVPSSPPVSPPSSSPLPWIGVAGGGGLVALGAVAVVVGVLPNAAYVEHNDALAAADPQNPSDADFAHAAARDVAADAYESYGQTAVVAGSALVAAGVVVGAGALVLALSE